MWDALDITEEEAQGLAEIARHDLELARDFARRALATQDNDEANRLARSYQRAARSYRQDYGDAALLGRRGIICAVASTATATADPWLRDEQHSPHRLAAFDVAMGLGGVLQREGPVDDHFQAPVGDILDHLPDSALDAVGGDLGA